MLCAGNRALPVSMVHSMHLGATLRPMQLGKHKSFVVQRQLGHASLTMTNRYANSQLRTYLQITLAHFNKQGVYANGYRLQVHPPRIPERCRFGPYVVDFGRMWKVHLTASMGPGKTSSTSATATAVSVLNSFWVDQKRARPKY